MDKIKAVKPNIIVRGNVDKPYYLIEYYDVLDNEWHIGYGSYCLANVKEWLKTCFEVINADITLVKHGYWDNISESCSVCGSHWAEGMVMNADDWGYFDPMPAYCPYCGAKMDEGDNTE